MALSVSGYFSHRNVLITGSTGYLGKVLLEKLLRTQEGISRIYLLIRSSNAESAKLRMDKVLQTDLFEPLKRKHGLGFEDLLSRKVVVVEGDIGMNDELGIESEIMKEELYDNIHIVINNAATTSFDDRYDTSLSVNTLGAENVVKFAKRCKNVETLVHVSTAYVTGRINGIAMETPLEEGVRVNNGHDIFSNGPHMNDIDKEIQWLKNYMEKLKSEENQDKITHCLKVMGVERLYHRARKHGWPNTYSFTKAMGEMLVKKYRENLPVVIVRPSIIQSTIFDPFPGWIEGTRTLDVLIKGYAKGYLNGFLGHPDVILDIVPADLVTNAIIVGAVENAKKERALKVYHIASSNTNPFKTEHFIKANYLFFTHNPCVNREGVILNVKELTHFDTMQSLQRYLFLRYGVKLKMLELLNKLLCNVFESKVKAVKRGYDYIIHLAELYEPYAFFHGRFDVTNMECLNEKLNMEERKLYTMDLKSIDWFKYYYNVHIMGLVKHVFK